MYTVFLFSFRLVLVLSAIGAKKIMFFSKLYTDLTRIFIFKYGFRGPRVEMIFERGSRELVRIRNGFAVT
jgi:hypothetical protein